MNSLYALLDPKMNERLDEESNKIEKDNLHTAMNVVDIDCKGDFFPFKMSRSQEIMSATASYHSTTN